MSGRLRYQGFISYSHTADSRLARAVQSAVQRFARPWYRVRPLASIFRDETSLAANPALWPSIERNLNDSEWLLLMASPGSAASVWVGREVDWWLVNRGVDKMLVLLTDGEVSWNYGSRDFDWDRTTALSGELAGKFSDEPLYVDLRWARHLELNSLSDPRFRAAILDITAPLLGRPKDEIDSEDIRHFRNFRWARNIAVGTICAFLGVAVWQWREAVKQRDAAEERRKQAVSAGLASAARFELEQHNLDGALLLAAEGTQIGHGAEARSALLSVMFSQPRLIAILHGQRGINRAIAFNPRTGDLIAGSTEYVRTNVGLTTTTAFPDALITTWGTQRSSPRQHVLKDRDLTSLAVSPDGNHIAMIAGGRLTLSNAQSGASRDLDAEPANRKVAVWSADGKMLAASAGPNIHLWVGGKPAEATPHTLEGGGSDLVALALGGPSGDLAWADDEGRVVFMAGGELSTPVQLAGSDSVLGSFPRLTFTPNGELLIVAGEGKLWVYAVRVLKEQGQASAPDPRKPWIDLSRFVKDETVGAVAASGDGKSVAVGTDRGRLLLWLNMKDFVDGTLAAREPETTAAHGEAIAALAFSADGTLLASASEVDSRGRSAEVRIWNVRNSVPLARSFPIPDGHWKAAAHPGGDLVVSRDGHSKSLTLQSLLGRKMIRIDTPAGIDRLSLAGARRLLAATVLDGRVHLWDAATGNPVSLAQTGDKCKLATINSAGVAVACAKEKSVELWDLDSKAARTLYTLADDELYVVALAFTPDGRSLAFSVEPYQRAAEITILDTRSGKVQRRLPGRVVTDLLAYGTRSEQLLSSGRDGVIRLWDVAKGIEQTSTPVTSSQHNKITAIALSPDGGLFATAESDTGPRPTGNVRFWSAASGLPLGPAVVAHANPVHQLVFTEDGRQLISTSTEPETNAVLIWNLGLSSLRDAACEIATRNLTCREWRQHLRDEPYRRTCPTIPSADAC